MAESHAILHRHPPVALSSRSFSSFQASVLRPFCSFSRMFSSDPMAFFTQSAMAWCLVPSTSGSGVVRLPWAALSQA
jgi:hypothetical protein